MCFLLRAHKLRAGCTARPFAGSLVSAPQPGTGTVATSSLRHLLWGRLLHWGFGEVDSGRCSSGTKVAWRRFVFAWRCMVLAKSPGSGVIRVTRPGVPRSCRQCWCFTLTGVSGWARARFYTYSSFLSVRADYSAKAVIWQSCLHCFTEPGCLMSPSVIFRDGNRRLTVEVQIRFSCRTLIALADRGACWLHREQDHCEKTHHQWRVLEYICLHGKTLPMVFILSCWWEA